MTLAEDLALIADQARWAHTHGWWKEGHGLAVEHGTDLSKPEHERMSGPTYDLQIGSHPAREAYHQAVAAVRYADRALAAALWLEGVRTQPPLADLDGYAHPLDLAAACTAAAWRADRLTGTHAKVTHARGRVDKAVRGLSKALDHGPAPYTAHRERPCRTCEIRERVPRKAECNTCDSWRKRHDGQSRPRKLDLDSINEARAAQQRRLARDEGWGAA